MYCHASLRLASGLVALSAVWIQPLLGRLTLGLRGERCQADLRLKPQMPLSRLAWLADEGFLSVTWCRVHRASGTRGEEHKCRPGKPSRNSYPYLDTNSRETQAWPTRHWTRRIRHRDGSPNARTVNATRELISRRQWTMDQVCPQSRVSPGGRASSSGCTRRATARGFCWRC